MKAHQLAILSDAKGKDNSSAQRSAAVGWQIAAQRACRRPAALLVLQHPSHAKTSVKEKDSWAL